MAEPMLICTGCCLDVGGDAVLEVAVTAAAAAGVDIDRVECLDVCGELPAIGIGERRAAVSDPMAVTTVIDTLATGGRPDLSGPGLEEVTAA